MSTKPTLLELLAKNPAPPPPKKDPPKRKGGWRWLRKQEQASEKPNVLREAQEVADRARAAGIHPRDVARAFDEIAARVRQKAAMSAPLDTSIF
jgi:hypothetical protein